MRELKVEDHHRVNELSLEEGGATVKVVMKGDRVHIYDKIKSVRSYIEKVAKNDGVLEIWHEGTCLYKKV